MAYGIKEGYIENPGPVYFHDDVTTTRGIVFQPDVYTFAERLANLADGEFATIVDVGCGWGDKLAAMHARHPVWEFVGIDYGDNIRHCIETYDWGRWIDTDLESIDAFNALDVPMGAHLICSDVIEHLVDPVPLVKALKSARANSIVISTPERDVQYGYDHMGPSQNLCHVREWNAAELKGFLESEGLTVHHIGLTRGNDQSYAMGTILAVCS